MQLITLVKKEDRLIPTDEFSVKIFNSLDIGQEISFEYKENKQRNYRNHKRFFSMLQGVVHNSSEYKTVDNLLSMLKLKVGYFEIVVSHKGEQLYIPKSINFATMKEDDFQSFFSDCIDILLEFMPEEDVNSIMRYA
jgi:hypothetical protein